MRDTLRSRVLGQHFAAQGRVRSYPGGDPRLGREPFLSGDVRAIVARHAVRVELGLDRMTADAEAAELVENARIKEQIARLEARLELDYGDIKALELTAGLRDVEALGLVEMPRLRAIERAP